uniref:Cation-transporting ATPase n=2 Tax=Parascaris univalens TaxID=6257 RepID=A0A915AUB1_PARUN
MASVDQLVHSITSYTTKPIIAHAYVGPLVVLYGVWLYLWCGVYGINEYWELGCIVLAGIGILQVLTLLFCHWFIAVHCLFTCSYEPDVHKATTVKVVPTPNNGWAEMVPLRRTKLVGGRIKLWFEFQKVHYTFDEDKKTFRAFELDTNRPIAYFQDSKGLETDEAILEAKQDLGDNQMEMVIPQFMELFKERATAPFFVFQVFCVGLWCLEDMWYYSVFTLMMLITFEATLVKQQLKNMSEIHNMGNKPCQIYAYRNKRWNRIKSDELLPGDIVSIGRSPDEQAVPCDLLLLRGPCIVDESMLTGESVPQMKEPIEDVERSRYFDFDSDSRLHVIFGGTKVVQHSPPAKNEAGMKAPDGGCICFVLRTGFNTSQGRLLRTIMFGVKRVTANNLETFAFILFLLVFAIAASTYLWIKGSEDESRSKYKLFLECSLILTSVIPPELPIELSLAVNNSLMALQKLGVFCTEPFRIPFAGKIDVCCFDKTGTLTTDNLVVEGIALANSKEVEEESAVIRSPAEVPPESVQVLVACHSLVRFDEELVGDPLEKACLNWADWNLTKNDTVIPKKSKMLPLKIFHRYHFSSAMKRMTVIAGYMVPGTSDTKHLVAVKGAPETLKIMYASVPNDYDDTYQQLTRQGARVLALAIKELGTLSYQEIRDKKREDFERDLKFAGFVVISCPLKPDTKAIVREIIDSSHRVVMITGDNPLTACHVAKVLRFTKKSLPTLVLDEPHGGDGEWRWKSVNGELEFELVPKTKSELKSFIVDHELCITGVAFSHLLQNHQPFFRQILQHITVFARMAPKQKERIINELKALGWITLMCGDGTNDVGALKHANVGVALLSHPFDATKAEERRKKKEEGAQAIAAATNIGSQANHMLPSHGHGPIGPGAGGVRRPLGSHSARRNDAPTGARQIRHPPMANAATRRLEQMMKELEEEEKAQVVRLGDASVAAPFTSKYTSLQSICHVIKQGRCTLVTTLQMFKILALNALVLAYSQSVLYLDGIKFSDAQATIQGLLLAACFLFISRSRPLKTLAKQRPIPNIFNAYTLLTVSLQFAVHFGCLLYVVQEAHRAEPREKIDLDAEFKPNLLNSAVYVMAMALQVSTFAVNYRGRPFMESLMENKPMLYSLLFSGSAVFALASGISPELTEKFELVELPIEFRNVLVACVTIDLVACFIVDRILCFLLGDMRA